MPAAELFGQYSAADGQKQRRAPQRVHSSQERNLQGKLALELETPAECRSQIESCLTYTDAHVVSGSEDNSIYVWSLVDVRATRFLVAVADLVADFRQLMWQLSKDTRRW